MGKCQSVWTDVFAYAISFVHNMDNFRVPPSSDKKNQLVSLMAEMLKIRMPKKLLTNQSHKLVKMTISHLTTRSAETVAGKVLSILLSCLAVEVTRLLKSSSD